jgi:hypothetical protein
MLFRIEQWYKNIEFSPTSRRQDYLVELHDKIQYYSRWYAWEWKLGLKWKNENLIEWIGKINRDKRKGL